MSDQGLRPSRDPARRAMLAGAVAAPVLLALGIIIGLVEGGLLPGTCQGLACLFSGLVFGATATIALVWLVLWVAVRLARRRWPRPPWRLWRYASSRWPAGDPPCGSSSSRWTARPRRSSRRPRRRSGAAAARRRRRLVPQGTPRGHPGGGSQP